MNLDRLAVNARPRSSWESVDLGILLARRHWLQMTALWLFPAALLFLVLGLIFPGSPGWVIFAIWWLKPVFERLPLLVASRQLFGERMDNREALSHFRRANGRDWLAWISWRRLSFTRAFDMPLTVLENATGRARATRLSLLHRKAASTASWLHIVGVHVEMILGLGVMALVYTLLPEQLEIDWLPLLNNNTILISWITNGVSLLIMAAVAPFYVYAGFMLYIGRRVELEAWDLEIHFRKMRARFETAQKPNRRPTAGVRTNTVSALVCAVGLILCSAFAVPPAAQADVATPAQSEELIDEVLAEDDFHRHELQSRWRLKEFKSREQAFPQWLISLMEWLEGLGRDDEDHVEENAGEIWPLVAGIIELLLWITAAALIIFLLWFFRYHLRSLAGYRPQRKTVAAQRPDTLFGLDVRSESLPDDVTAEVLRLWHSGAQRDAMGLLYRASLANLISRFDCAFEDHLTEAECAQLVREEAAQDPRLQPALVQFFGLLTSTWQRQAYAHRPPANAQLETLCRQWQQVFHERETGEKLP
ncbi:hypothetical protein [Microbulbifer sp. MCCC 1A16149]|uniref:hypothetical protein n=1 Tax=Microbulbifer sp. MCCC 1A16149 TaxID=3411322 RepID=UPI003D12D3E9